MIGGERPDAAPVGDDHQPVARERPLAPQGLHGGEHGVEAVHGEQSRPAESGLVDGAGSGERTRMGLRLAARRLVAAGAQHHHRLGTGRRPRGRQEFPRIRDMVQGQDDRTGVIVLGEVIEAVGDIDIGRAPQRHHRREADAVPPAPLGDGRGDGAGLRDEGEVPWLRRPCEQTRVQAALGHAQSDAVGADQPQAVLPRRRLGRADGSRFAVAEMG
ncbi:hypothetical protein GCM10025880_26320 [Methylorubrum aminovorans]|nr:hypothetical protein GCM10025880_26320 [Methylorubrum aminovorans]